MKLSAHQLTRLLDQLFRKFGTSKAEAREVSTHLVMSNLRGSDSHGAVRALWYIDKIRIGEIVLGAAIEVENETPSSAVVNGNWGFGQPIARFAMELAIKKARECVVACVTAKNCNHVGRIGAYTSLASKEGMIGLGMANLHGTSHVVAPFGGIDRKLPTNPISIALPRNGENDFLLDMSSCMVSEGILKMKLNNKQKLPEGWIMDSDGNATLDPKKFYEEPKGAILPLGGISAYKGFALSLAIDALGGALSGAQCSNPQSKRHGNACCFIVIRTDAFRPLNEFKDQIDQLSEHVKSSRISKEADAIYMPGEPELQRVKKCLQEGIEIDDETWKQLCAAAEEKGLNVDELQGESIGKS